MTHHLSEQTGLLKPWRLIEMAFINIAVSCQPYQRGRLEHLWRYVTRSAVCLDRLTIRANDKIQYELKNPFRNGTTHILFSPLDFLSKLAALVPRPHHNLVRYHGLLARGCHQPNSKMRQLIVPKRNRPIENSEKREWLTWNDGRTSKSGRALCTSDLDWTTPTSRKYRYWRDTGPPTCIVN